MTINITVDNRPVTVEVRGGAGLSAYDLWLAAGNTGSLADFINTAGGNLQPQVDAATAAATALMIYTFGYIGINEPAPPADVPEGQGYVYSDAGRVFGAINVGGAPANQFEVLTSAGLSSTDGAQIGFSRSASYSSNTVGKALKDRTVNPCDAPYNAKGDGTTNDNAAFMAALQSGRIVDGGGRTFAIRGVLRPTSFAGLRNCKLKWLDPGAYPTGALLDIVGISNFDIDSVEIDIGTVTNTGAAGDSNRNGLRVWSSNPGVTTIEGFRVSRVTVTGNGHGSRIQIRGAKRFHLDDCYIHDCIASYTTDPTNDIMNGIDFKYCTNFTFSNCRADRLLSVQSGTPTNINTRGYLVAECQDFLDVNNSAYNVGQGCDYSGAITATDPIGVRGFSKIGGVYADCGYFGVKFANCVRDGRISDVMVIRPGMIGVVVSGSNVALSNAELNTQNLDFHNCKVIDPVARVDPATSAPYLSQGFRVMENSNSPTWPRGIRFHNCVATDTQASPKMAIGFNCDVTYDGTSRKINEAVNCLSRGHTQNAFQGLQKWECRLTGTGTQAVASSTASSLNWALELADSTGMHSTSSNSDIVTIPLAGRWRVSFIVNFASAANGYRQVELRRNGNPVNGGQFTQAPSPSAQTTLRGEIQVTCAAGDTIRLEAYQDSGSPVAVQMSNSFFYVELLEET